MRNLAKKANATRQFNAKYRLVQEARLRTRLKRRFDQQMNWLIDEMQQLSFFKDNKAVKFIDTKAAGDEIKKMAGDLPFNDEIAGEIVRVSRPVYLKGAKQAQADLKMGSGGIEFDLVNQDAVTYLQRLKDIHLSNFKGSISRETRRRIIKLLTEAADTGASYGETAKLIREQGKAGVFSRARGELIAVNQIGRAYGDGNAKMIERYIQQTSALIQKMWITSEDALVTQECQDNKAMGWIGKDEQFKSGDRNAPRQSNPRCRCDTGWRQVDTQGKPI